MKSNSKRKNLGPIFQTASNAVFAVTKELGEGHEGKGGYFRLFSLPALEAGPSELIPMYEGWIGGTSNKEGKEQKYRNLSYEKALRLAMNAKHYRSFLSSWTGRNVTLDQYGGAVLLECNPSNSDFGGWVWLIFSFSGLPELADEAAMLKTAQTLNWDVNPNHMVEIIKKSNNELAGKLLQLQMA